MAWITLDLEETLAVRGWLTLCGVPPSHGMLGRDVKAYRRWKQSYQRKVDVLEHWYSLPDTRSGKRSISGSANR